MPCGQTSIEQFFEAHLTRIIFYRDKTLKPNKIQATFAAEFLNISVMLHQIEKPTIAQSTTHIPLLKIKNRLQTLSKNYGDKATYSKFNDEELWDTKINTYFTKEAVEKAINQATCNALRSITKVEIVDQYAINVCEDIFHKFQDCLGTQLLDAPTKESTILNAFINRSIIILGGGEESYFAAAKRQVRSYTDYYDHIPVCLSVPLLTRASEIKAELYAKRALKKAS